MVASTRNWAEDSEDIAYLEWGKAAMDEFNLGKKVAEQIYQLTKEDPAYEFVGEAGSHSLFAWKAGQPIEHGGLADRALDPVSSEDALLGGVPDSPSIGGKLVSIRPSAIKTRPDPVDF